MEEKKNQQRKLLEQKKSQPSKEAAMAYLEKKKQEAKKRAEQEAKELLDKKRSKALAENQLTQKKSDKIKRPEPTKQPAGKLQQPKSSVQTSKSSKPKINNNGKLPPKNVNVKTNKPASIQKPVLSYQDVLKLADQNKDKPKTVGVNKPKEVLDKASKSKSEGASSSATASSSSSSASKLTPEQIAKLREKQKKPSVAPIKPGMAKTDINNNKNKIFEKSISKSSLSEQKNSKPSQPSLSAWDRIMSDMKKNPSVKSMQKHLIFFFIILKFKNFCLLLIKKELIFFKSRKVKKSTKIIY